MGEATDSENSQIGEISSSKYRILRLLGEGGMGAVYAAEHLITKRTGALKLLHRNLLASAHVVERFMNEASAAGRVRSPHIVETFDAGRLESGHPYIFMELLSGIAFDNYLAARRQLPFDEAIGICLQAASGLAAAHQAGIVHRDIKPANLFLVDEQYTLVKLLDFGISKFDLREEIGSKTEEGVMLGTPHYMPSEQLLGMAIDDGVDIYALGVVLYEALTGDVPFQASTLPELSIRVHAGQFTPVSELRPDAPAGLDDVIARCLAVNRVDRHSDMHELLAALAALLSRGASISDATLAIGPVARVLSSIPPSALPGLTQGKPFTSKPPAPLPAISSLPPRGQLSSNSPRPSVAPLSQSNITLPPPQAADVTAPVPRKTSPRRSFVLGSTLVLGLAVSGYLALRLLSGSRPNTSEPVASSAVPVGGETAQAAALSGVSPSLNTPPGAAVTNAEANNAATGNNTATAETSNRVETTGATLSVNSSLPRREKSGETTLPPPALASSLPAASAQPAGSNALRGNPASTRGKKTDELNRENPF